VIAGTLCFLIGVYDLFAGVRAHVPPHLEWVGDYIPGAVESLARTATVIVGMLLLLLSHALRRRKRRAWEAAVLLLSLSVVFHLVRGLFVVPALIGAVLLGLLVYYRGEFYASGDPRTRWRAVWVFCLMVGFSLLFGLAYIRFNHHHLAMAYGLTDRLEEVVLGLVGITGPVVFDSAARAAFGATTLGALGLLTALVTAYLLFRPAKPVPSHDAEDERRMRDLLRRHGARDSLGYFALRKDKSVIWSPTGKACVTYRVVAGVMLASGDPLGDPEAWPGAIHAFLDEAARHAWVPAVMGCGELGGEVWTRESGLDAIELGDEAIVDVGGFTLSGRSMRNVRQMVTRVERQGYEARLRRVADVSAEELADIEAQAGAWLGRETERGGFSMALGRIGAPGDAACAVATAHHEGKLAAVLHFVPWGEDGLSLELMRRDRAAAPGLNDFLIVYALRHAGELGVRRLSLNFAVFRSALERGERLGAGPVLRVWRGILLFLSRWFQIESLYRFNAKFGPTWEPRFIVFPHRRDWPRIAFAAMEAEAFLTFPHPDLGRLRRLVGR
jgi:lysyl-tRNA synthetase class 2